MQINSNKHLLDIIRKHEVGIKYPDLIPHIAFNIVRQRDKSIYDPSCYSYFHYWFYWENTREGYDFWFKVDNTLTLPLN